MVEPLIRVLVTGGRDYTDRATVADALVFVGNRIFGARPEEVVLVHGGATGADTLAAAEAQRLGWRVEPHPVKDIHYRRWGKAAPLRRNQAMVDMGANYCLVFPGGNGTAHCKRAALNARIPIIDIPEASRG